MPTPAYTELDSSKPDGTTSPTTYSGDDVANVRAERDQAIIGRVKAFLQSRTNGTGTADQPQYITWTNSTLGIALRIGVTWTGFKPTSVQWEWSNDTGATWANVGSAQANTVDSAGNITASTNSGGFVNIVLEVWGKTLKVISDLATHLAATGTAVHGLGTMATQPASGVAITGGTIDNTPVGNSTRAKGSFTRVAEDVNVLTPGASAAVTIDWNFGGTKVTHNGTHAVSFSNIPAGFAGHIVDLSNFNQFTWPAAVDWGVGGIPSIAGRALVTFITDDTGTKVFASASWQAV